MLMREVSGKKCGESKKISVIWCCFVARSMFENKGFLFQLCIHPFLVRFWMAFYEFSSLWSDARRRFKSFRSSKFVQTKATVFQFCFVLNYCLVFRRFLDCAWQVLQVPVFVWSSFCLQKISFETDLQVAYRTCSSIGHVALKFRTYSGPKFSDSQTKSRVGKFRSKGFMFELGTNFGP